MENLWISTEISRKKCSTFPGFPRILKSVVNDQSSSESMEIMIQLNVCHESAENMENTERVEHNFDSFHGVTESAERMKNVEYNLWKFHDFHENVENKSERPCRNVEGVANKNLHFRQCNCIKLYFSQCIW